ncbi:RNA polymerase sigma factor [Vulcaniibacterium tengchongense]|uniref:RNA polymerase sigma-70 factor (ECF subfamily) n=1 Tax=Vulcaniibacterium tengchongense TaxID=1273429 RepID=A0A3N4VV60_9GAMM|nr:sigma-70 family RNA polymerase sigma factor [Vulcaniibacterium tengchongense]RPE80937.1 RNA polymerase sigma-70 factor (ECF subfamily) [Vulcaniibacterium tengchongense]
MPPSPRPDPTPEPPLPAPAEAAAAVRSSFAIDVPEALLARARAGEAAAFEQIYRRFERPVFTLALRLLGGARDEAADVLQDTMLKVLAKIGDYRGGEGGGPFWGWLRQIAINEALMRLRSRRRHEHELPLDEDFAAADAGPLPAAAADAAALARALAQLPAATRSVLWLYHAEGYTHEEIAALMQRTPSFSKSQLARGGRRLRRLLEPETAHA